MTDLENYRHNAECLTGECDDLTLKKDLLKLTFGNLTYAKTLYAWITKEGKEKVLFRRDIVRLNFDFIEISARRCQDDSYLLAFDEIYNWMIEK